MAMATRTLLSRSLLLARIIPTTTTTSAAVTRTFSTSTLIRLRPLSAAISATSPFRLLPAQSRALSSRVNSSSLKDQNPNWSNRPPKETILLDGCDFEHWLIVLEKPEGDPTRDEIIDSYIKTLAMVVGSEEEARMKIYSVSTRHYFAFGALVSEELSYKIKELPKVRWVLPDSYLDVKNKDYGGEPFINGQAVPYDPKYHEEWVRNNARATERNKRNDRPRNFDRSRNFERRRENMQNRDGQNMGPPPVSNMPPSQNNAVGAHGQNLGPTQNNMGPPPSNFPSYNAPQANIPRNNYSAEPRPGNMPPNNYPGQARPGNFPQGNMAQNSYPPQNNYSPQNNYPPQSNYQQNSYPPQSNYQQSSYPQNAGNYSQPGVGSSPQQTNTYPPQNNMMPPQPNAGQMPSHNFPGNGPQASSAPNGNDQTYNQEFGAPNMKPY